MGFSEILRDLRKEKKLTQKELATYLGLTSNSICEWENQRSEPSMASILKMCALFDVSTDYLLGRTDEFGAIASATVVPQSSEDREILSLFHALTPEYQAVALNTLRSWAGVPAVGTSKKKA